MIIEQLARDILENKLENKPFLVAIDGKSCAGKTAFADSLGDEISRNSPAIQVVRPSIDGFHNNRAYRYRQGEYSAKGYYEDTYDITAIIQKLLNPLKSGPYPVNCQSVAFDYRLDIASSQIISLKANTVLLFEGLFVMKPEINTYWDYRILLDITDETSLNRALIRDVELLGDQHNIRKKYDERYTPAWHLYEDDVNPMRKADIIIDNNDYKSPKLKNISESH